jgi:predicted permease
MAKLFNLLPWRRRRLEQDLDREVRYHLDRRVDDLRRSGLKDADARRQAVLELGGVAQVQEEVRDTWIWRWLDDRGRDLRYAGRALRRSPGFAATALLSLALGIGANAAVFSLVDQVLLRRLPVPEPERLVHLDWSGNSLSTGQWGTGNRMSYPLCRELHEQQQVFDGAFCRYPTGVNLSTGQAHEPVDAEIVSGSYFSVLGVRPAMGRLLDPSDDLEPGARPVVVLSYNYWRNHLGSEPDVVGRPVRVNDYPMTVIGIAPASFRGVDMVADPDLWIPAMMTEQAAPLEPGWNRLLSRRTSWMHVFGRLKPDVTMAEAKVALQPWFRSMLEEDTSRPDFPSVSAELRSSFLTSTIDLLPAARGLSNARGALERPLLVLMGGTTFLVLLASLNVAGLLLARGAARTRELMTRMALGASRDRITGQLLVESLLIVLGGGVLGLLAAPAVSRLLRVFLPQGSDVSAAFDYRVVLFAFLVSVVAGGVCSLAPILQSRRIPLIAALNERTQTGAGSVRFRKALVIGQIAFTLILLTGAGLFAQTLARLHAKAPAAAGSLVLFRADPPRIGYADPEARRLMRELARRLQDVPVIEGAAAANTSLLAGGSFARPLTIQADDRLVSDGPVYGLRVTPGFFSSLGMRLISGRDFEERDTRDPDPRSPGFRSAIVNESFARRYFGDRDPVGHRLGIGGAPETPTDIEIVGVVEDLSYISLRRTETEHVFLPFWDRQAEDGTFYLRMRGEPESAFASIRAAVAEVEPRLPVELTTFADRIDQSLTNERMLAAGSSVLGTIALLLAVVGLYGVISFVVARRTPEIGVRLALGSTRAAAVWLIIRDAVIMIGVGTAVALPCVWALGRLVESELFGVSALDRPTIALASTLLALVALAAAMLAAWRAASINPTEALRVE